MGASPLSQLLSQPLDVIVIKVERFAVIPIDICCSPDYCNKANDYDKAEALPAREHINLRSPGTFGHTYTAMTSPTT